MKSYNIFHPNTQNFTNTKNTSISNQKDEQKTKYQSTTDHVNIFSGLQKFLGFSWPFSDKVCFHFQGSSIRFELCLFLFYEVARVLG